MLFSEIIEKLAELVECHSISVNNFNPQINRVDRIDLARAGSLAFIEGQKFAAMVHKTNATALILPLDEDLTTAASARGIAWLATREPRLLFAKAIALFYQPYQPAPGIHPSAAIDRSVVLGQDVSIGPHVAIYPDVTIGARVTIHANAVIYPQVKIGSDTILHANCTIHERAVIGANCTIHSGAVIGAEGFSFVPTAKGPFKMEQSGRTVLEDGVEVGCNSAVDRPAVGETRIKRNTKLDNLVHIAHGCQVGENCFMAAQTGLAGAVKVGNGVMFGIQVGIANNAKIGDGAVATAQTSINNRVAPGAIVSGSPAVPNALYRKVSAIYKRLPQMYQTFRKLPKN